MGRRRQPRDRTRLHAHPYRETSLTPPQCYAYNGRDRPNIATDVLAIFTGRRLHPRADKRRQPPRALQVFPRAHEGRLLDYIVMGVLMLERKRLAPWGDREGHFELKGNIHATQAGVR
jgi:hypothetical protein